jgi:hypothetical protein
MMTKQEHAAHKFVHCTVLASVLHIRRLLVRFQMVSLEFFIDIILPIALLALGSTQPLTEPPSCAVVT